MYILSLRGMMDSSTFSNGFLIRWPAQNKFQLVGPNSWEIGNRPNFKGTFQLPKTMSFQKVRFV